MKHTETQDQRIFTRSSDFLLDGMWSDHACEIEPSYKRELFAKKISELEPRNILSTDDYLSYLGHEIKKSERNGNPNPHKALFQHIGTNFGLTEPTTRVVPTRDLSTAYTYGLHLLENHDVIWIGTGSIDDHSDPGGKQNLNPPLYKNIRSREDLLDALQDANEFELAHPGSYLKLFPQDREKPAIGSMVFSNNKAEGNLVHLKIRRGEYTTSERKAGDDKPISISLDLSGPIVKIYTNQSTQETNYWLKIILNSQELFQKLDNTGLTGSDYINPEFLIFLNGKDTKIAFFTDCIWGSKAKSKQSTSCPKTNPLLIKLSEAITQETFVIVPENHSQALMQKNNYLLTVLNTLKSARSATPDMQTAQFILKTQEALDTLTVPFKIPQLDQITLNALWRISRGYPLDTTINIIEYMQNQLKISELKDPNIAHNRPLAKLSRYFRRHLPYWLYRSIEQQYKNITDIRANPRHNSFYDNFRVYAIRKSDAIKLVKATQAPVKK